MPRPIAVLLLVACTMLWGFAFIAQKTAMDSMGPLTFSAVRYLLGAVLVTPLAIREYRRRRPLVGALNRRQMVQLGVLSLAFFLGAWLQQHALLDATVTNAGFLTALYVIFTPFVTLLLLGTRPHPIILVGAPLALVGIYLLTGARLDRFTFGDGELVVCAVCWAIQVTLLGALVGEREMPVVLSTITFYATAVLSLVGALVVETPTLSGISAGWVEILYTGVLSTAVGFTLQAIGQQYVPPSNAAIVLSAESLFAALGGALLLGERLPLPGYLGAVLIFVSILLVEAIPALRARRPITVPGSA